MKRRWTGDEHDTKTDHRNDNTTEVEEEEEEEESCKYSVLERTGQSEASPG